MKQYPPIPGPWDFFGRYCVAYKKYDGSNLRFEWSAKRGWYKFGARTRLFDRSDSQFGDAVDRFLNGYGQTIIPALEKLRLRLKDGVTVFCEYFGPRSFAGWHEADDPKQLMLIEVNINRRGILLPGQFTRLADHIPVAETVYEGVLDRDFVGDVRNGEYVGQCEGVVVKGARDRAGQEENQHSLWMAKVKTFWWLRELRTRAQSLPSLQGTLKENLAEQREED